MVILQNISSFLSHYVKIGGRVIGQLQVQCLDRQAVNC